MIKTRTHAVAMAAYERVFQRKGDAMEKEYRSLAHAFPSMILQNRLAQATGFLLAKGKGEHKALLEDMRDDAEWKRETKEAREHKALLEDMRDVLCAAEAVSATDAAALHKEIISADALKTMQLTRHALEASAWIKRYAQGLLDGQQKHRASPEEDA